MDALLSSQVTGKRVRLTEGDTGLRHLFHAFPRGRTGLGLLLLRVSVGVVLILQGKIDLAGHGEPTTAIWVAGGLAMVSGLLLLAGFLTPIAAAIGGLRAMSAVVSLAPAAGLSLFISKPSSAFLAAITAGIVILGPGSFSVDSRLFGLREVIIPILRVPRRGRDSDH